MNILITGANGFIGRSLTEKLLETNDNIFLVSRDEIYQPEKAKVFYGDLSDKIFCNQIVEGIDMVYYLAGYKKNISFHTTKPSDFIMGNVEPLVSFLREVEDSNIKKIIYLSSTHVGLYKDGDEDGYVIGKYINELILKSFAKQYNIDIKIVRSAPIYGPGDNFNPETGNFIPSMINKIYKNDKEISVWGSGKRELQFVYVDDLVSNLVEISKSSKHFFEIGNQESLTINQIVERLIKLSGKSLVIKNDETKPDKKSKLFDFNNLVPMEFDFNKGLEKTVDYYNHKNNEF